MLRSSFRVAQSSDGLAALEQLGSAAIAPQRFSSKGGSVAALALSPFAGSKAAHF
jgi:hypothetical protein